MSPCREGKFRVTIILSPDFVQVSDLSRLVAPRHVAIAGDLIYDGGDNLIRSLSSISIGEIIRKV